MVNIKSQKITPSLPAEASTLSFVLTSQDALEHTRDWDFFAIFDLSGHELLTTQVSINILKDTFTHEADKHLEDEPILQTLEKALRVCKEAMQKFAPNAQFNAVVAVFKAEHVYTAIYGNSKALYLDGSQVGHVDTGKEGNYASGSQKIVDGKVMVLCTNSFFTKFPPKSLVSLTKPILGDDLDAASSAVILKVSTPVVPSFMANYTSVPSGKEGSKKARRFTKPIVGIVTAVLIAWAGYMALKPKLPAPATVSQNTVVDVAPKTPQLQTELTKKLDEANKVRRVAARVFYDISIADAEAVPNELALGVNYIAICDTAQGKIYISTREVTKFEELPQLFPGVKNLLFEGDALIFTDNEGLKFYSLATKAVTKSYLADPVYPTLGPSSEYLGFTYALSGDKLVKFSKAGAKLSGNLWLQKPEFTSGISVDIDGSIYVLFANGNLEKYTGGTKDDFSIVGLDKPIQKPLKVVTNASYKQIYVGDGAEGRLVVFDTDGILAFQIKPQPGSEWVNLKSFDVSADEKTFYVLAGTKVYEFTL